MQKNLNNQESPFDTEWSENIPNTNIIEDDNSIIMSPLKNTNILRSIQNLTIRDLSPNKSSIYDPSMDITSINDVSIIETENENKSVYKDDMVYLSSIYDAISRLNKKFNKIVKNKFVHKNVITDLYKKIQGSDTKSVKTHLEKIIDKKDIERINNEEILNFIKNKFPELYNNIKDEINTLDSINQNMVKNIEKYKEILENKNQIICNENYEFKRKVKNFISKYNKLTMDHKIDYDEENNIEAFLEKVFEILQKLNSDYQNVKNDFKILKDSYDINELKKQLEEKKFTIKQLQSENISFSDAITKLDTQNIKLKKECVILSNEYKKIIDSIKLKNRIIEKQKHVLDVLQKQVGKNEFPIDELKNRVRKIRSKLEKESSEDNKNKLNKELDDCVKRMKDFQNLKDSPR